ncbi:MAG: hypothetical protein ACJ74G_15390 [Blastocatellia bacterium]
MFDEYNPRDEEEEEKPDQHWQIVQVALYAAAMLAASYVALSGFGWWVAAIGSIVLTLAAFAAYQWVKVWLNARRQERGPEDDGSPISLNLSSPAASRSESDDK